MREEYVQMPRRWGKSDGIKEFSWLVLHQRANQRRDRGLLFAAQLWKRDPVLDHLAHIGSFLDPDFDWHTGLRAFFAARRLRLIRHEKRLIFIFENHSRPIDLLHRLQLEHHLFMVAVRELEAKIARRQRELEAKITRQQQQRRDYELTIEAIRNAVEQLALRNWLDRQFNADYISAGSSSR